jgi:hypothetical protein
VRSAPSSRISGVLYRAYKHHTTPADGANEILAIHGVFMGQRYPDANRTNLIEVPRLRSSLGRKLNLNAASASLPPLTRPPRRRSGRLILAQFCANARRGRTAEIKRLATDRTLQPSPAAPRSAVGREQNPKLARHLQNLACALCIQMRSDPGDGLRDTNAPSTARPPDRNFTANRPAKAQVQKNVATWCLRNAPRALMRGRQGRGKAAYPWRLTLPTNIEPS